MKLLLIQRKEHILLKGEISFSCTFNCSRTKKRKMTSNDSLSFISTVESEIELAITVNKDRIKMNSELMDEIIKVELVKPELNYGKEIIQQTNNLIKANEYLCALDRMFKEIFDGKRNAQLNRFNNDYVQLLEVTYAEFESNKIGNCDNKFTLALINLIFRREVLRRGRFSKPYMCSFRSINQFIYIFSHLFFLNLAITDSKAALEAKESISNAYIAREQTIESKFFSTQSFQKRRKPISFFFSN